jgi:hypothetical protein
MHELDGPPERPFFEVSGLKLRIWPIVLATVVMAALSWPISAAARWLTTYHLDLVHGQVWAVGCLAELVQMAIGLVAIVILRRVLPRADAHLRWPPGRSHVGLALAIGVAMAVIMGVADFWPLLLAHTAPPNNFEMTPIGVPGWLAAMLLAGPTRRSCSAACWSAC